MLVLASLSPRRRELLKIITPDFDAAVSGADENIPESLAPHNIVRELALRKALAVSESRPFDTIIGADTIVTLGGQILGKPHDAAHAATMLRCLSGRRHSVYTGVAIVQGSRRELFHERTEVEFRALSEREIKDYIATSEPMDKAGAYGIQEKGALFVKGICGDYFNVVGLPLCALAQKLADFGF